MLRSSHAFGHEFGYFRRSRRGRRMSCVLDDPSIEGLRVFIVEE